MKYLSFRAKVKMTNEPGRFLHIPRQRRKHDEYKQENAYEKNKDRRPSHPLCYLSCLPGSSVFASTEGASIATTSARQPMEWFFL